MPGGIKPTIPDLDAEIARQLAGLPSAQQPDTGLDAEIARQLKASAHVPYREKPPATPSFLSSVGDALVHTPVGRAVAHPLETAISVGQGIPGGKAAQAILARGASYIPGMSSTGPMTYADALESVEGATKDQPLVNRVLSKIPGAMVTGGAVTNLLGKVAPAAVVTGAKALKGWKAVAVQSALGGAQAATDRALSAKPEPLADRLLGTVESGAIGAVAAPVISKGLDLGNTKIQSMLAKPVDVNMVEQDAAQAAEAAPRYARFRALGDLGRTPALDDLLGTPGQPDTGLPLVKTALQHLKDQSPVLRKLPDTDARVLDALYKQVGHQAYRAQGYAPEEARTALMDAIEEAANAKGGTMADAVQGWSEAQREIEAVTRGQKALNYAAAPKGTPPGQTLTMSPAAFTERMKTASPGELESGAEGILGQLKHYPTFARVPVARIPLPWPSKALRGATSLLDATGRGVDPRFRASALADLLAAINPR